MPFAPQFPPLDIAGDFARKYGIRPAPAVSEVDAQGKLPANPLSGHATVDR